MPEERPTPGIAREARISDEGLARLDRQLARGAQPGDPVLTQWIRRYGDAARDIIRAHGHYHPGLEPADDGSG